MCVCGRGGKIGWLGWWRGRGVSFEKGVIWFGKMDSIKTEWRAFL